MKRISNFANKNSLFLKIVSISVLSIVIVAFLVAGISLRASEKAYMKTYCGASYLNNQQVTLRINDWYDKLNRYINETIESEQVQKYISQLSENGKVDSDTIDNAKKDFDRLIEMTDADEISMLLIDVNGKSYFGKNDTLISNPADILSNSFTQKVKEGKGETVTGFTQKQLLSSVKGNGVYVAGKAIYSPKDDKLIGYVFAMVSQSRMQSSFVNLKSNDGEIYVMDSDGLIISSTKESSIGTVDTQLRDNVVNKDFSITDYGTMKRNGRKLAVVSLYTDVIDCYITTLIDVKVVVNETEIFKEIVAVSVLVSVSLIVIIFFVLNKTVKPIYHLIDIMSKIDDNGVNANSKIEITDDYNYETMELARVYNIMIDDINKYIHQLVTEQTERRRIEMHALQMQINPHFIYNTLTSIKWLVWQGEEEKSVQAIDAFSQLLRNIIGNKKELITVSEEVENLKKYIFLFRIRFSDKIKSDIYLPKECENLLIPKLLIQPLVENSFYHAFNDMNEGIIHVFFRLKNDDLIIEVIDNGSGIEIPPNSIDKNETSSGIGLQNTNQRIKLLYGEQYEANISSSKNIGTTVTIKIPAKRKDEIS